MDGFIEVERPARHLEAFVDHAGDEPVVFTPTNLMLEIRQLLHCSCQLS